MEFMAERIVSGVVKNMAEDICGPGGHCLDTIIQFKFSSLHEYRWWGDAVLPNGPVRGDGEIWSGARSFMGAS